MKTINLRSCAFQKEGHAAGRSGERTRPECWFRRPAETNFFVSLILGWARLGTAHAAQSSLRRNASASTRDEGAPHGTLALNFGVRVKSKRSGSGFTLVEILVVISILGILAALIFPAVRSCIASAQAVQSTNNLHQLVIANIAYATENGFYCPADDKTNNKRWCGARTSDGAGFDPTKGYLANFLGKSSSVTMCPLFKEMIKDSQSFELGSGGYGYNSSYVGGLPGGAYNPDGSRVSARITGIERSKTVMFTTSAYANGNSIQEYPYCEPPYWDFGDGPTEWRPSPSVHFRFNGKALVGWCDGHVSAESCDAREVGYNPHGGDATAQQLGWFGADEQNGFWNPKRSTTQ